VKTKDTVMLNSLVSNPFRLGPPAPVPKHFGILILDDSSFDRLRIKREVSKAGLSAVIDEISEILRDITESDSQD